MIPRTNSMATLPPAQSENQTLSCQECLERRKGSVMTARSGAKPAGGCGSALLAGGDLDLHLHVDEVGGGAPVAALHRNRLLGVARHADPDQVAAAD